jgi:hypothetical protein
VRVLSLGAGVQSSTLLLMAAKREIEPIDAAIFADTQWEPKAVYDWLPYLEARAKEGGIPLYRVTGGNLRADALAGVTPAWMPLFSRDAAGKKQQLKRQCTRNYKIRPIRRKVRALGGGPKNRVQQLVGISLDEYQRARTSDVAYIQNVYPLIDLRLTRQDSLKWLAADGAPQPARSTCVGCPFRTNREWNMLTPAEWDDATDFDERIRLVRSRTRRQEVFVHRSAMPLKDADLRSEQDRGQLDLFDGCGVLCASEGVS